MAVTKIKDMYPVQLCRLPGRLREQARSHRLIVGCQVDRWRLAGRHRRQASPHIWTAGCQVDMGRLADRYRRQASPHLDCGVSGRYGPTVRPPSQASQLPHLDCGVSGRYGPAGRPLSQASPHTLDRRASAGYASARAVAPRQPGNGITRNGRTDLYEKLE